LLILFVCPKLFPNCIIYMLIMKLMFDHLCAYYNVFWCYNYLEYLGTSMTFNECTHFLYGFWFQFRRFFGCRRLKIYNVGFFCPHCGKGGGASLRRCSKSSTSKQRKSLFIMQCWTMIKSFSFPQEPWINHLIILCPILLVRSLMFLFCFTSFKFFISSWVLSLEIIGFYIAFMLCFCESLCFVWKFQKSYVCCNFLFSSLHFNASSQGCMCSSFFERFKWML
jgi:hypothetical protein